MGQYTPETYFINPAHESIARSRYYLKDDKGNDVEQNIFETFKRVNDYVFQNDLKHKEAIQRLCEEKKFMYAGRPLAQAGTGIHNMFNCFVLGIGDSREEISECQRIHFHIQAHGGGTGVNFSKLRPSGSWCKGANARSSGPEGFITAMGYLSSNIQQGGNRCLPGDARVAMSDGSWRNIDQVRPGDEILVFDKNHREVTVGKVLNFFENGVQDVYEYTLTSGRKVRSTKTHRWLGQQTDGSLLIRTVDEMPKSSTKIGFAQDLPFFGKSSSKWSPTLGYLLGDGCFTGDQIKLSVENDHIRQRFIDGIPKEYSYRENEGNVFITSDGELEHYLRTLGLYRCLAHEKFIPDEVFTYKASELMQIVEGLFATDGWITEDEIGYCSISEQLVRDVSLLLSKFGISGYIQIDNRPRKGKVRRALWSLRIKHPRFYNIFCDLFAVPGKVGKKKDAGSVRTRLANGINFYSVKEVQNLGPDLTYCIEVDHPDHLFIVDGAISHNSGANMGILEDWHPGLLSFVTKKSRGNWENIRKFAVITNENRFKQWQWVNPYAWQTFNVSVGLSDPFMRHVKRKVKRPWHLQWQGETWKLWDFGAVLKDFTPTGEEIDDPITVTVVAPDEEVAWHEAKNQIPFRNAETVGLHLERGPYELTAHEWFEMICTNAWEDGCPGIFFIDRAREYHNGEYFNPVDATNPCVTADTFIDTEEGIRQVKDLIGTPFRAAVNGRLYDSPQGFFYTGTKEVGTLLTKEGYSFDCTADHKVLSIKDGEEVWVPASDLEEGDLVVLNNNRSNVVPSYDSREFSVGCLLGSLLGDGYYNSSDGAALCFWGDHKERMLNLSLGRLKELGGLEKYDSRRKGYSVESRDMVGTNSRRLYSEALIRGLDEDKNICPDLVKQNTSFQRGFLRGWFDADGSVQGSQIKGVSVRLWSIKRDNLKAAQLMLQGMGIKSSIYKRRKSGIRPLPNGKGGTSLYKCRPSFELVISNEDLFFFWDLIGFDSPDKKAALEDLLLSYRRKPNKTKFTATVESFRVLGEKEVFDCTVGDVHRFSANGVLVHNCAEQILPQWSVCCLSSLVLPEFVDEDGNIDWEGLRDAVYLGVRALNHITLLNHTGIEKIDHNTQRERRIGLGTIGMHEMLIRIALRSGTDIRYSEESGRKLAKDVLKFIKHSAYEASIDMAKEIGPFPEFKYEEFVQSKFMKQLLKERPDLDEKLRTHGIANVTILTQAPTGTTGTITGYSSGCEPYFAMAYQRNSNVGTIMDGCPSFIEWLEEKNVDYAKYNFNLKELRKAKRLPRVFEEAQEIGWKDHLKMQAVFAEQVDSSVSKTINLPHKATVKDIMEAYVAAYDMGIKSTTVYRDGSKVQVLETMQGAIRQEEELRPKTIISMPAPKRPGEMDCDIHSVSVKGVRWKVLVGLLHGRPYETFCFPEDQIELPPSKNAGKLIRNGGGKYKLEIPYGDDKLTIKDVASFLLTDEHRMITRLLSTGLRHGAPLNAIVGQLSKCDGEVTAFSKALMRVLRKYISDEEYLATAVCQQCGSKDLVLEEGCLKCAQCGYSGCN